MADQETLSATPYAVHIPDEYTAQEKAEGASWELGAGTYEFGFEVNGARFPLARMKGGGVQKKLDAAKQAQESQQAQQTTEVSTVNESTTPTPTPPEQPPATEQPPPEQQQSQPQ